MPGLNCMVKVKGKVGCKFESKVVSSVEGLSVVYTLISINMMDLT